jgi:hypothetical protein
MLARPKRSGSIPPPPSRQDHRADGADNTDSLRRPAARLGGRYGRDAHAGAAGFHERWLHRRGAEPRAVPDRPARRRPALYRHTRTTSLTRRTSEITIPSPRTRSPASSDLLPGRDGRPVLLACPASRGGCCIIRSRWESATQNAPIRPAQWDGGPESGALRSPVPTRAL